MQPLKGKRGPRFSVSLFFWHGRF